MGNSKNILMKLTENFSKHEFDCKCGCSMNATQELYNVTKLANSLQIIRDCIEYPISLTNAHRCQEHNKSIGSKDTSQHILGKAADLQVKELIPIELYENY